MPCSIKALARTGPKGKKGRPVVFFAGGFVVELLGRPWASYQQQLLSTTLTSLSNKFLAMKALLTTYFEEDIMLSLRFMMPSSSKKKIMPQSINLGPKVDLASLDAHLRRRASQCCATMLDAAGILRATFYVRDV